MEEAKKIIVKFRKKGQVVEHSFNGEIYADSTAVSFDEIGEVFDLTKVPVVCIGGKKGRQQDARLQDFQESAPDFKGVIYLLPYSWSWGWSDGEIYLPSRDILKGKSISGGRPTAELVNFRWLSDGRYVADKVKTLHGKVIEVIQPEITQTPGPEKIAVALSDATQWFTHPLRDVCQHVVSEVWELQRRDIKWTGIEHPLPRALVQDAILTKLNACGISALAEIPNSLTITAEEIAPELCAQAETLGTIEIPGLGRVQLAERQRFFIGSWPCVDLSIEEMQSVHSWPFVEVAVHLKEISSRCEDSFRNYPSFRDLFANTGLDSKSRWERIRDEFALMWIDFQREKQYPTEIKIKDIHTDEVPETPAPFVWGFDLGNGEPLCAYAALYHRIRTRKGHTIDDGWLICWFDSADEATEIDRDERRAVQTYLDSRKLKAELEEGTLNESDILQNFGGYTRVGGLTGNQQFWVIQPDGELRQPTSCPGKERRWDIVGPEELALCWSKSNTGAEHCFEVVKLPTVLTDLQKQRVADIEEAIATRWATARGISGKTSPSIGQGWNL